MNPHLTENSFPSFFTNTVETLSFIYTSVITKRRCADCWLASQWKGVLTNLSMGGCADWPLNGKVCWLTSQWEVVLTNLSMEGCADWPLNGRLCWVFGWDMTASLMAIFIVKNNSYIYCLPPSHIVIGEGFMGQYGFSCVFTYLGLIEHN